METFESFLIGILVLVLGLLFGYAYLSSQRIRSRTLRAERDNEEFVAVLLGAFQNKALDNSNDITSLYEAHFGVARERVEMYARSHLLLKKLQLRISTGNSGVSARLLVDRLDELRQLTTSVHTLLKAEELKAPFYGTPEMERALLEDVLELTMADRNLVHMKLTRLAELIRVRQDTIEVLGEEKGSARRLAYWGLAGTVVFGVASTILGLMQIQQMIGWSVW